MNEVNRSPANDGRSLEIIGIFLTGLPGLRDLLDEAVAAGHAYTPLGELPTDVVDAAYSRRHPADETEALQT